MLLCLCPRQFFALCWQDSEGSAGRGFSPYQTPGEALCVPCPSRQLPGQRSLVSALVSPGCAGSVRCPGNLMFPSSGGLVWVLTVPAPVNPLGSAPQQLPARGWQLAGRESRGEGGQRVGQSRVVRESLAEHRPSLPRAPACLELLPWPSSCGSSAWYQPALSCPRPGTGPQQRMLSWGIPLWGSLLPRLPAKEEPWGRPPSCGHRTVCPDLPGLVAYQLQRQPDFYFFFPLPTMHVFLWCWATARGWPREASPVGSGSAGVSHVQLLTSISGCRACLDPARILHAQIRRQSRGMGRRRLGTSAGLGSGRATSCGSGSRCPAGRGLQGAGGT